MLWSPCTGDRRGQVIFGVSRFGYENTGVQLANVREPTRLEIRLTPNPGAFIERTVSGRFDPPPPSVDESRTTVRVNTRPGGTFDAVLQAPSCTGTARLRILAESGGVAFAGPWGDCRGARLRFVVPAPDVTLTLVGMGATDWHLIFREPR
jgi:hypothetical protein